MVKHIVFGVSSFLVVVQLGVFVFNFETAEWKSYQSTYYKKLAEVTKDPSIAKTPLKVAQIWGKQLDRADRCITCHAGVGNPALAFCTCAFLSDRVLTVQSLRSKILIASLSILPSAIETFLSN